MEIYILRHAIAVQRGTAEYPNDDRPLAKKGIQKMKTAAKGITNLIQSADLILTSPLTRAFDTAKIAAEALRYKKKIEVCKQLLPGNPPSTVIDYLSKYKNKKNVLIVGHEPDVGMLASTLLGSPRSIIEFKKGTLCRIDVDKMPLKEPGKLIWHLTPKQLRALAS
jgi:phosphohistidine phosphatase